MKKILAIGLIVLVSIACGATGVLARPITRGDFAGLIGEEMPPENETWFSIELAVPSFEASLSYCIGDPLYHFAYYLNDQTYAELSYLSTAGEPDIINLKGSYLFDFGFFIALDYYRIGSIDNTYFVSPGYRYSLNDQSYLAVSFDYKYYSSTGSIVGYKLAGQYYADTMSAGGEIYLSPDFGNTLEASANFKVREDLVCGVGLGYDNDQVALSTGLTWVKSPLIVDAKLGGDPDGFFYDLSGYYAVSDNVSLGLEYGMQEGYEDPRLFCKGGYSTKLMDLGLIYQFATDTELAMAYFTYSLKF